ncbi:hypothetical protein F2P45_18785 [Massilia sp. CCM 8733]|uniref:Uncharacterized protein n=2 Tax=Massilia mucilaginosa TaxID=2609282 RepID=A0ABX0NWF7_9BURK|nr:hypothetical protein [Massilia mucilaginosa]
MTCIETEEQVHKRQLFNRPVASIECVHRSLEDYLDETDLDSPAIIWFDYTEPKGVTAQIERFARTIGTVPIGSILRITLNANPESLGKPDPKEISVEAEGEVSTDRAQKPTTQEWRLARFKERLGSLYPSGLSADGMTQKNYGKSVLRALKLAVEKEVLSFRDRRIVWALATHYADGQAMVTAALVVCQNEDDTVEELVTGWEFYTTTDAPHRLDLPALSTLERLTMESNADARVKMGFELPKSAMGENPLEVFQKFYRIYPHFSRVEL